MAVILKKSFNQPDEVKTPEKIKVEIVTLDGLKIQRVTAESGWQWSKHIKPIMGGESCQQHHVVYILSGKLASRMDDGTELEFAEGEAGVIPPGHDGWTVGEQPVVWLEMPH